MPIRTVDETQALLTGLNLEFTANDMPHGRQFRFGDGAILNYYTSGKSVWQGNRGTVSEQRATEALGSATTSGASTSNADDRKSGSGTSVRANNRVFIVYGHDAEAREQLELVLRRLKLEPVILQNLPIKGETIIEKLENNSDVHYACILLTPDDEGHAVGKASDKKSRARQNVILEMGMFLARLGRKRVAILHKGSVELPSDIHGLIYIRFNKRIDEIKDRLAAELQEAGFQINIKDLLS